jgi:hypothetical protein
MILMAGKNRGRFLAWRHSLSLSRLVFSPRERYESLFIDKNLSYKKCQYNKFEANARASVCVCVCVRIWPIHFSAYSAYAYTYTAAAAWEQSPLLQHVECEARPAINFKYPFYGPITAPCFAIPLNIGPGRVSSSYLAAPFYAAILLLMKFLSLSCLWLLNSHTILSSLEHMRSARPFEGLI